MVQFFDLGQMNTRGSRMADALGLAAGSTLSQKFNQIQETQKNSKLLEALSPVFKNSGMSDEEVEGVKKSGLPFAEAIKLAQLAQKRKQQMGQENDLQGTFNRMVELLDSQGIGRGSPKFFEKSRENIGEFENLRTGLISAIRDQVNKGVLTNQKFNFILKTLPTARDFKSTSRGKLRGIAKELGLDASALGKFGQEAASESSGKTRMMTPKGERWIPNDQVEAAKRAGAQVIQ